MEMVRGELPPGGARREIPLECPARSALYKRCCRLKAYSRNCAKTVSDRFNACFAAFPNSPCGLKQVEMRPFRFAKSGSLKRVSYFAVRIPLSRCI